MTVSGLLYLRYLQHLLDLRCWPIQLGRVHCRCLVTHPRQRQKRRTKLSNITMTVQRLRDSVLNLRSFPDILTPNKAPYIFPPGVALMIR